jgi:three-Cys-motif partner protein
MATLIAGDGLPARVSGDWAQEKLRYVEHYLQACTIAMRKKRWAALAYLDLLAGPGLCVLKKAPAEEFDGSPLRALGVAPAFDRLVFVEKDRRLANALRARASAREASDRWSVIEASCDAASTAQEIRRQIPDRALTVAFVDTLACKAPEFASIARVVDGRKVDLVVTFMVSDLTRNVREVLRGKQAPERFDAFFGTPDWIDLAWQWDKSPGEVSVGDALASFYENRLRSIGYTHTQQLHRLMKTYTNAPLYRLIFASRDVAGEDIWRGVTRHGLKQRGLAFD